VSVILPENGSLPERQNGPTTLAEAHEALRCQRPERSADPREWVVFHRHSARVYSQTAEIDRQHRHEAFRCAGMEIRKARDIEHRINPQIDDEEF
jgi:hypothetical protein